MDDSPSKRPSSLTLLQVAREELATAEQKDIPPFLPERPLGTDYIFQAILELLERFFHSYTVIEDNLRKHLIEKIRTLLEDGKLRSTDCWGLDKSLPLALVLGTEDKAKRLLLEKEAVWECPWKTYGLTAQVIATYGGLDALNELLDRTAETDFVTTSQND